MRQIPVLKKMNGEKKFTKIPVLGETIALKGREKAMCWGNVLPRCK